MTRLDAMLQPRERILFGARKPGRWPAYVVATVAAVLGLPVVTLGAAAALGAIRPLPFVLVGSIAGGVMAIIILAWLGDRIGPHLVVTDRRLLRRHGILRRRILSLDHGDILSADAYLGSGVLQLHLAGGGMRRFAWLEAPDSIVRALGCPARIWPRSPDPEVPRAVRLCQLASLFSPIVLYELAVIGKIIMPFHGTAQKLMYWGIVTALILSAGHWSYQGMHRLAARRLPPEKFREFACRHLDPRCRGGEPYPEAGGYLWDRLGRFYVRWTIRRFYGGQLDCDCRPVEIGPASVISSADVGT